VIALGDIDHWAPMEAWGIARRPGLVAMVRERLGVVDGALAEQDYLAGEFSVGDILTIQVLRQLRHTRLVEEFPALTAWRDRCQSRPAFQRALAAQLRDLGAGAG
jgi:glutathione S-transferase